MNLNPSTRFARSGLFAFSLAALFAACSKSQAPAPVPGSERPAQEAVSTQASSGNPAVDYAGGLQSAVGRAKDAAGKANAANQTQQQEIPKE